MNQLELFPLPYTSLTSDERFISPLKMPTVGFDINCPRSFVNKVLQALDCGLMTVSDYQGNKLKIKLR